MYETRVSQWAYLGAIVPPPDYPGACQAGSIVPCDASVNSSIYPKCYDTSYGGGFMATSTWQASYGGGGGTSTGGGSSSSSSTGGTSPSPPPVLPPCSCTLDAVAYPSCDNAGYTMTTSMYQSWYCGGGGFTGSGI